MKTRLKILSNVWIYFYIVRLTVRPTVLLSRSFLADADHSIITAAITASFARGFAPIFTGSHGHLGVVCRGGRGLSVRARARTDQLQDSEDTNFRRKYLFDSYLDARIDGILHNLFVVREEQLS